MSASGVGRSSGRALHDPPHRGEHRPQVGKQPVLHGPVLVHGAEMQRQRLHHQGVQSLDQQVHRHVAAEVAGRQPGAPDLAHALEGAQISLQRIGVEKEVRRLDQKHLLVLQEQPDRVPEEVHRGHVVGVEDRDERRVGVLQPVLEGAGLEAAPIGAGQVVDVDAALPP